MRQRDAEPSIERRDVAERMRILPASAGCRPMLQDVQFLGVGGARRRIALGRFTMVDGPGADELLDWVRFCAGGAESPPAAAGVASVQAGWRHLDGASVREWTPRLAGWRWLDRRRRDGLPQWTPPVSLNALHGHRARDARQLISRVMGGSPVPQGLKDGCAALAAAGLPDPNDGKGAPERLMVMPQCGRGLDAGGCARWLSELAKAAQGAQIIASAGSLDALLTAPVECRMWVDRGADGLLCAHFGMADAVWEALTSDASPAALFQSPVGLGFAQASGRVGRESAVLLGAPPDGAQADEVRRTARAFASAQSSGSQLLLDSADAALAADVENLSLGRLRCMAPAAVPNAAESAWGWLREALRSPDARRRFEGVAPGGADALSRETDRLEFVFRWGSDLGAQRPAAAAFMLQRVADACAEWSRRNGRIGEFHDLSGGGDEGLSRLSAMALSAGLELGLPGAGEWAEASAPA